MSDTIIRMVSAHWHDDRDDGISVGREFDADGSGNVFAEACERALTTLDMGNPKRAMAWLDEMSRGRPRLSDRTAGVITATIHWLERRHHIVSDNFNGVVWVATRAGEVLAIRHDELLPADRGRLDRLFPGARVDGLAGDKFEQAIRGILHTPASN